MELLVPFKFISLMENLRQVYLKDCTFFETPYPIT
ncbi:hypothetical protein SAMN05216378_2236 [Paenibacillus catalpae]|uniref:Uncharacterized protein n=1 Tax=Paenibacillus catalpae TaxID=1045775 RepID=A0A1I1XJV4_9BACL|nr:hypothetical protein SAMN05216378_2236 [Paenibacillus catalpae]